MNPVAIDNNKCGRLSFGAATATAAETAAFVGCFTLAAARTETHGNLNHRNNRFVSDRYRVADDGLGIGDIFKFADNIFEDF